ncbi:unnamed protein product [Zymoseptoria tritici ST99CH_3D7]|uniref:Uncharacterized protein n=1 Tax=Zymoseptoria tritici (strain ST99CH_3D7) TaxID=1276538 RepID=A0A1X7S437_ZYMT9|nr:unnamed protein product [Zymoseptoria tritici ST99CH_3D7]
MDLSQPTGSSNSLQTIADFRWSTPNTAVSPVFTASYNALAAHQGKQQKRIHEIKEVLQSLDGRHLNEHYNPADRFHQHTPAEPIYEGEQSMAILAFAHGYALVIVDVKADSVEAFEGGNTTPRDVRVRWSLLPSSESYPPLFVGRCLGRWFALKFRKSPDMALWSPQIYDWAGKLAVLRFVHGSRLNVKGVMYIVAVLVCSIRAGFSVDGNPECIDPEGLSLDVLIVSMERTILAGGSVGDCLRSWYTAGYFGDGVITLGWAVRAMTSSSEELPRKVADVYSKISALADDDLRARLSHDEGDTLRPHPQTLTDEALTDQPSPAGHTVALTDTTNLVTVAGHLTQNLPPNPANIKSISSFEANATTVRFKPSGISQMPTFCISLRENHMQGRERKDKEELRKELGERFENYTAHGQKRCHVSRRLRRGGFPCRPGRSGILPSPIRGPLRFSLDAIRFTPALSPTRSRLNTNEFSVGSAEETFAREIAHSPTFTILVNLQTTHGDARAKQAFDRYSMLVGSVRRLTLDGRPQNDWLLSRNPSLLPDEALAFVAFDDSPLDVPDWLKNADGTYQYAHASEDDGDVSRAMTNERIHHSCFEKAMLQERDHRAAEHAKQFNDTVTYPCRFALCGRQECGADIRLVSDDLTNGRAIVPMPDTEITLTVGGRNDNPLTISGTVAPLPSEEFQLRVLSKLYNIPEEDQARLLLDSDHEVMVTIQLQDVDRDTELKLQALSKTLRICAQSPTPTLEYVDNIFRPIAIFCLRSLIIGPKYHSWGPNMVEHLSPKLPVAVRQNAIDTQEQVFMESDLNGD